MYFEHVLFTLTRFSQLFIREIFLASLSNLFAVLMYLVCHLYLLSYLDYFSCVTVSTLNAIMNFELLPGQTHKLSVFCRWNASPTFAFSLTKTTYAWLHTILSVS